VKPVKPGTEIQFAGLRRFFQGTTIDRELRFVVRIGPGNENKY
jgi:hypothetical protein